VGVNTTMFGGALYGAFFEILMPSWYLDFGLL